MIYPVVSGDYVSPFQRENGTAYTAQSCLFQDLPRFFYHLHPAHILSLYILNENQKKKHTILKKNLVFYSSMY